MEPNQIFNQPINPMVEKIPDEVKSQDTPMELDAILIKLFGCQ